MKIRTRKESAIKKSAIIYFVGLIAWSALGELCIYININHWHLNKFLVVNGQVLMFIGGSILIFTGLWKLIDWVLDHA